MCRPYWKQPVRASQREPRFFSEVSPSSYLGGMEGLAKNSKPVNEVGDSKSEKSAPMYWSSTVARIMSTTLKIGIWGGWLTPQLEKKFKLLYPYRNTWMHQIQFINANNCHASANVFTIYSILHLY